MQLSNVVRHVPRTQLLITSSRPAVLSLLYADLQRTNFRIITTHSNSRSLDLTHRRQPSILVLSIVVPKRSNFRIMSALHNRKLGTPILFLATHSTATSGMQNLAINNSSCIAGPFDLSRIRTHIHTLLHQDNTKAIAQPSTAVGITSLRLSSSHRRIQHTNRIISLAPARFGLLHLFVRGPGQILDGSIVLSHI